MSKASKEEKANEDRLDRTYEATPFCPVCNLKLPIDSKSGCNSPICK